MAVTATPTIRERFKFVGGQKAVIANIALTGTYVANGFALTAAKFGLVTLNRVIPMGAAGTQGAGSLAYSVYFDNSTKYIKLYAPSVSSILSFSCATLTASATKYIGRDGAEAASAAAACPYVIPQAGILRNLYVSLGTAPGATKTYIVTPNVNAADPTPCLSVTVSGAGKAYSDTATANAMAVAAGDLVVIKCIEIDGSAAVLGATISYVVPETEIVAGINMTTIGTPVMTVMAIGV